MNDFIAKLLDHKQPMEITPERTSVVMINLKTARLLCGRNIETGDKLTDKDKKVLEIREALWKEGLGYSYFSGIMCYLVLLEQLGQISNLSTTQENAIYKVLKTYNNVANSDENYTLVGLRNALAHNGGLVSKSDNYPKKFVLSLEESNKVVELPQENWDNNYSNKSEDCNTIIYVNNFINLVEDIFRRVKEDAINGSLTSIDEQEIKSRFTVING